MARVDAAPVAALEDGVAGDQPAALEDADLRRMALHLERAATRPVGHRVEVAAHRDHALTADPALDRQHHVVGARRQRDQVRPLVGERLVHRPAGGRVDARVGDLRPPRPEAGVEVVEVAERAVEEEVLADVAERPLDLALGLGAVGPARPRRRAVVLQQHQQRRVVDHPPRLAPPGHALHFMRS